MSRYIDADALREKWLCLQGHDFSPSSFVYSIDNAPTVDAVPVRCKECKWFDAYGDTYDPYCDHKNHRHEVRNDFFCADGERRSDEQQTQGRGR